MIRAALFALLLWPLAAVVAQDAQALQGELTAGSVLRDPDFNLAVRAPGLRRQVDVWIDADDAGPAAWRDSAQQPGSATALPIVSQTWFSTEAALGAQPVAADLLALMPDWQPLRIDSAQLPENLSAVFVVVDGELYSGNDPAAPITGDLRIRWTRLPTGPVSGVAYWRDGAWHAGPAAALRSGTSSMQSLPGLARGARPGADLLWWLLPLSLLPLIVFSVVRRRR